MLSELNMKEYELYIKNSFSNILSGRLKSIDSDYRDQFKIYYDILLKTLNKIKGLLLKLYIIG
jgi:hypothetical protein